MMLPNCGWGRAGVVLVMELVLLVGRGYTQTFTPCLGASKAEVSCTDLGTLGGRHSSAIGINDLGQVVGASMIAGDREQHAFIWTAEAGMVDLGILGGAGVCLGCASARGINNMGQVVGCGSTTGNPLESQAFLVLPEDTDGDGSADLWFRDNDLDGRNDLMHVLETLGGSGRTCASGINERGHIVGVSTSRGGERHGSLWTPEGSVVDLGTIAGDESYATAINELGDVVGSSRNNSSEWRIFVIRPEDIDNDGGPDRWFRDDDLDGVNDLMTDIGSAEYPESSGGGINDFQQVSGSLRDESGIQQFRLQAFRWSAAEGLRPLGTLGDRTLSVGGRINNAGDVVGESFRESAPGEIDLRAFLWTETEEMMDLGTLGEVTPGVSYGLPADINNLGQIVGESSANGGVRATLWTTRPLIGCENDFDANDVAVMFVPDSYFSDSNGDGILELDTQKVALQFYCSHPDEFHFLTVFSSFDFIPAGVGCDDGLACSIRLKHGIAGLGLPTDPDHSPLYGSTKLEAIITMHEDIQWWPQNPHASMIRGLSNASPLLLRPLLEHIGAQLSTLDVLGHEFLHRWGPAVKFSKPGNENSCQLLDCEDTDGDGDPDNLRTHHWSFFLDSDASVMYGNDWRHINTKRGLDLFLVKGVTDGYNQLDLYLMGLLDENAVEPFFFIDNPTDESLDSSSLPARWANTRGTRVDVTIQDVVDSMGSRLPTVIESPKKFRQAFILVLRDGEEPDFEQIQKVNKISAEWEEWFGQKTNFLGSIETTLN